MSIKAELRSMALIVRHFAKLSPAGRAWVLARLTEDNERLESENEQRRRYLRTEVSA